MSPWWIVAVLAVLGIGYFVWRALGTRTVTTTGPQSVAGPQTTELGPQTVPPAAPTPQIAAAPASPSITSRGWSAINPVNGAKTAVSGIKTGVTTAISSTGAAVSAIGNAVRNPASLANPITGVKIAVAAPVSAIKSLLKF